MGSKKRFGLKLAFLVFRLGPTAALVLACGAASTRAQPSHPGQTSAASTSSLAAPSGPGLGSVDDGAALFCSYASFEPSQFRNLPPAAIEEAKAFLRDDGAVKCWMRSIAAILGSNASNRPDGDDLLIEFVDRASVRQSNVLATPPIKEAIFTLAWRVGDLPSDNARRRRVVEYLLRLVSMDFWDNAEWRVPREERETRREQVTIATLRALTPLLPRTEAMQLLRSLIDNDRSLIVREYASEMLESLLKNASK